MDEYEVKINGIPVTMQLKPERAKQLKAKKVSRQANKSAPPPQNKSTTVTATVGDGEGSAGDGEGSAGDAPVSAT